MSSSNAKITSVILGLVGLFVLCISSAIAGPVPLKFGWTTVDSPTDPYAFTAHSFKKALDEVAPGEFDVSLYPNRQLGDEKEMLEGLSFGTLDSAVITNAVIAQIAPGFQINDMPFLYADQEQAYKVLDGPVGMELMKGLVAKNIIGFGFPEGGYRSMINNVRPIYTPDDVQGIKWRVMQNPVYVGMFRALGGNAVPMAWGEVFTAVQQGTIDGLEIPVPVIYNNGYYEVTKYLSLTRHTYSALGLLMSKRAYEKLSDAQKEAVQKAARLTIDRERAENQKNIEKFIGQLKEKGMQINDVKDKRAFREKVKPVYDEFRSSIGPELFDRVLAQIQ
jgi:tripartite ATP-independent transporter DctP family solute receptor